MATNFRRKISYFGNILSFIVLALWNGLQYRNSNFKTLNCIIFLCIVLTFGKIQTSISRVYGVKNDNFCGDMAINLHITPNIPDRYLPTSQIWQAYGWGWLSWHSFVGRPRDLAMATTVVKFWGLFSDVARNDFYYLLWRSTTDSTIVTQLSKD